MAERGVGGLYKYLMINIEALAKLLAVYAYWVALHISNSEQST